MLQCGGVFVAVSADDSPHGADQQGERGLGALLRPVPAHPLLPLARVTRLRSLQTHDWRRGAT